MILCYCTETWAYFTDLPLNEQGGSGWLRVPWEYNSDPPEGPDIIKVAWDGDFLLPGGYAANSPYSVNDINAGVVCWLAHRSYPGGPTAVAIPAGTTLEEFRELITDGGGHVYV